MRLLHVIISLLVVLMFCTVTFSQSSGSTTASLTGVVRDPQGAVIGGATIVAHNVETNLERTVQSEEDGSYLITQLPPGEYQLTATAEAFKPSPQRVTLTIGTTGLLNFSMALNAEGEVIVVRANTLLVEGQTEKASNIDKNNINNLPINQRDFLDFTLTTPGATVDRLPAQGASATSGLSFNGQSARENNLTMDGLDNNDPGSGSVRATFSQDAVQEFQVVSGGYSAEFGRALGGVINIITRGGTNEYHGTLFYFNRSDRISARDVFAPIKPPYEQDQAGATFSGPVRKDREFFFLSAERRSIRQSNFVTISDETIAALRRQGLPARNGPVPLDRANTTLLARGDLRPSPNDTLWVRYNYGGTYNGALEPFGGLRAETAGGVQRLSDSTIAVSNTYLNVPLNLINETRFLYTRRKQTVDTLDPFNGPEVDLFSPGGEVVLGRNILLPQPREQRYYEIVDNVSLSRGRNQIKTGVDLLLLRFVKGTTSVPILKGGQVFFTPIDFASITGLSFAPRISALEALDPASRTPAEQQFFAFLSPLLPQGVPGFPKGVDLTKVALPLVFVQGFGNSFQTQDYDYFSAFVQDDVKLRPNLIVKAGLRYDRESMQFLPSNSGNFSPRLAIAYRPRGSERLSLHATYGIFHGTTQVGAIFAANLLNGRTVTGLVVAFPFSILSFMQPGHRFPESETLPAGVPIIPQLNRVFAVQPNFRNGYAEQANTGFDYQLQQDTVISVSYQFVRGIKLFLLRNINPIVRPIPGSPVQSAITGRIDTTRGDVFELESSGDSYYHGITLLINRRLNHNLSFQAHYTFSKTIDTFSDWFINNVETQDPLSFKNERALSLQDVRSRFVFAGVWNIDYSKRALLRDYHLSAIVTLNSGSPYNLLTGVDLDLNGDFPPADRPLRIGRNAGIAPGFASVDMRFSRVVHLGERVRFEGLVEVFNLFNRVNISDENRLFPPQPDGSFLLPPKSGGRFIVTPDRFTNAFAPRQFQIGLRLIF